MIRETVSKDAIRNLNGLSWDKKMYANFQFADGNWGLEVNYYFEGVEYKYKVICDDRKDMVSLRRELDVKVV